MKILFFILFSSSCLAQNYTLEDIGDDYLFDHFSPVYEYPNSEKIIITRRNNRIGLLIYTDSTKSQHIMQRFYNNGMISLVITDLNFKVVAKDTTFVYCTSGNVKTFYPNGRLRTEYTLDSIGNIEGILKQYSFNGNELQSIYFSNGKVSKGTYIEKWNDGYYFYFRKNEKMVKEYYLSSGVWYKVENRNVKSTIQKKSELRYLKRNFRVLNKDYSLNEEYAITYPLGTNR